MHPVLDGIRREIQTLDEEVILLSNRVSDGEREDELKETLRANLRKAKKMRKDVERYLQEGWAGAEEWMITTLTRVITVCEVSLSEFRLVPSSFERAYQS